MVEHTYYPTLRRLRQEDRKFQLSLVYTDPSKKKTKNRKRGISK